VSILGSRAKEDWERKVEGPNEFERSYILAGSAGEHEPVAIGESTREAAAAEEVVRIDEVRMAKGSAENPRLTRITEIALALPDAKRQIHGSHAQFLVKKKTFAYFLDNHHGDGIISITGKVLPGDNKALAEAQPRRFVLPAYIASRGWVALRLDQGKIDWHEVRELLLGSYALIAPKRLAEKVKAAMNER
jgi:predicted DNA-binding protein (MmcQ/YjbR family)